METVKNTSKNFWLRTLRFVTLGLTMALGLSTGTSCAAGGLDRIFDWGAGARDWMDDNIVQPAVAFGQNPTVQKIAKYTGCLTVAAATAYFGWQGLKFTGSMAKAATTSVVENGTALRDRVIYSATTSATNAANAALDAGTSAQAAIARNALTLFGSLAAGGVAGTFTYQNICKPLENGLRSHITGFTQGAAIVGNATTAYAAIALLQHLFPATFAQHGPIMSVGAGALSTALWFGTYKTAGQYIIKALKKADGAAPAVATAAVSPAAVATAATLAATAAGATVTTIVAAAAVAAAPGAAGTAAAVVTAAATAAAIPGVSAAAVSAAAAAAAPAGVPAAAAVVAAAAAAAVAPTATAAVVVSAAAAAAPATPAAAVVAAAAAAAATPAATTAAVVAAAATTAAAVVAAPAPGAGGAPAPAGKWLSNALSTATEWGTALTGAAAGIWVAQHFWK